MPPVSSSTSTSALPRVPSFIDDAEAEDPDMETLLRVPSEKCLSRTPSGLSTSCPILPSSPSYNEMSAEKCSGPRDGLCVLTIGCFDMFHRGHLKLLTRLMSAGVKLVVGVHDDESVRVNKNIKTGDSSTKRFANVRLALRPNDEVFLVHAADPTPYWLGGSDSRGRGVDSVLGRLRRQGWEKFAYMRGDDMQDFPGRAALEKCGVPVHFFPYTQGVSATKMRAMWGLNMQVRGREHGRPRRRETPRGPERDPATGKTPRPRPRPAEPSPHHAAQVIPDAVANPLLAAHEACVYAPLRALLSRLASCRLFPRSITPNMVTFASVACALPYALLTHYGWHLAACALCVFHDLLDRLDGAVAGVLRKRDGVTTDGPKVYVGKALVHDGEYGAYLDAMGDKAFGITALLSLALLPAMAAGSPASLPLWWSTLALLKIPLHAALAIVRTQDYRAKLRGESNVALPSVGVGKLATCAENFGCAAASLALGLATPASAGAGWMGSFARAGGGARAAVLYSGWLGVLSIDMAARSLSHRGKSDGNC